MATQSFILVWFNGGTVAASDPELPPSNDENLQERLTSLSLFELPMSVQSLPHSSGLQPYHAC